MQLKRKDVKNVRKKRLKKLLSKRREKDKFD
jgi:hypothetical protein